MNDQISTAPTVTETPVDTAPQPVEGGSYSRHPETHELQRVLAPLPEPDEGGTAPGQHIPTPPSHGTSV